MAGDYNDELGRNETNQCENVSRKNIGKDMEESRNGFVIYFYAKLIACSILIRIVALLRSLQTRRWVLVLYFGDFKACIHI